MALTDWAERTTPRNSHTTPTPHAASPPGGYDVWDTSHVTAVWLLTVGLQRWYTHTLCYTIKEKLPMARLNRRFRLAWRRTRANHGRKPNLGKSGYGFKHRGARPAGKAG